MIWDLAIHDLSIMDYVLPSKATAVSATGISHIPGQPENVAYITLFFANPQIAHVHVNWLTPVKVRHTLIGGSEKMILYDDLEPSEKVKIYDKGVTMSQSPEAVYEMLVSYRSGDMWAPRLDATEALQTEALHFIDCIENRTQPETDGQAGLRLVRTVEAAEKSLRAKGELVEKFYKSWPKIISRLKVLPVVSANANLDRSRKLSARSLLSSLANEFTRRGHEVISYSASVCRDRAAGRGRRDLLPSDWQPWGRQRLPAKQATLSGGAWTRALGARKTNRSRGQSQLLLADPCRAALSLRW